MMTPLRVALTAHPAFHTVLLRLEARALSAGGSDSITNALMSGVPACIRVARSQNAPTAVASRRSAPSVTRKGSEGWGGEQCDRGPEQERDRVGAEQPGGGARRQVLEQRGGPAAEHAPDHRGEQLDREEGAEQVRALARARVLGDERGRGDRAQ